MRLIAIDTALDACSVAIVSGAEIIAETEVIGRGHAERLMAMIEAVMTKAGSRFSDLDRIAVTVGPGSFTGIRVGLATARGLALAAAKPLVGVLTLDAMAHAAPATDRPLLVVLDARRGETYARAYAADGEPLGEPQVLTLAAAAAVATQLGADLYGSAAGLIVAAAPDARLKSLGQPAYPEIAAVAALGARATPGAVPPKPLYLRAPDAKPQTNGIVARAAPPVAAAVAEGMS